MKLVAVDKTDELHEPRFFQPQPSPDTDYTTQIISEKATAITIITIALLNGHSPGEHGYMAVFNSITSFIVLL